MRLSSTLPLLIGLSLLALAPAAWAQPLQGTFETIGPLPAAHSQDVVTVEEFLNFTCPHCNNFRELSKPLFAKYGKRIRHINVPVLFRGQSDAPLRLFYVAEKQGRGEEVKNLIFDATFRHGVNVYDPATVGFIARSAGLAELYSAEADAAWVTEKIAKARQRADQAGIEATPTLVLNGSLRLTPQTGMQTFVGNLDRLIEQLLK